VKLRFFPDLQIDPAHPDPHVLGGARLGALPVARTREWPAQAIPARLPGSLRNSVEEVWVCDTPCSAGVFEGINWRRTDGLLYGVLELDESDFSASFAGSPLQAASREAYRRIFSLLEEQRLPNLWRAWNYLAEINRESNGLERYRQFNIGRQEAFLEFRRGATGNVPTACAIGLADGPLRVAFIAGNEPAEPIENPRQISAYNYPAEYGPSSPTFSRAALVRLPGQELLFVSGTASILGHRTVHPGDVANQTRESLANVAAVVAEANRLSRSGDYSVDELAYRVYLRHADHFASVREALASSLGATVPITYVQADICRVDLLVEIEGIAAHAMENSPR
jgi:chorismate lyase / 3-hydroxybenzoate synthase